MTRPSFWIATACSTVPVRDGKPYPPAGVDQLEIFPDAADALRRLKEAGYLLIVVTNQPDVARGTQTRWAVDRINTAIGAALPIDEFLVCAHDDAGELRLPQAQTGDGAGGRRAPRASICNRVS